MGSRIAKFADFPQSVCISYGIHFQNRDHSVDTGKIRYFEQSLVSQEKKFPKVIILKR